MRVARCESTDYYAPFKNGYVGAFQLAAVHAPKFAAHSWDYYVDGDDPYRNSVVALEIFQSRGWAPWPVCGLR